MLIATHTHTHTHHALGASHLHAAFFMYLSDLPAGGETVFPRLRPGNRDGGHELAAPSSGSPLAVSPRLGDAVLWPSVLDAKPMESDIRTEHEAKAVAEGVKYGVNLWVHQFDWKLPSSRGCELTQINTFGRRPSTQAHARLVKGHVPSFSQTVRMAAGEAAEDDAMAADDDEGEGYGAKAEWPEVVGMTAQEAADIVHMDRPDVNVFFAHAGSDPSSGGGGSVGGATDGPDASVMIWIQEGGAPDSGVVVGPAPRIGGTSSHEP